MTKIKYLLLCSVLALGGCGGSSGNPTPPTPSVGQWVDFGGNEPSINQGATPSFDFPGPPGWFQSQQIAGYFYTQLPAVPKAGQTLTINYSVDGSNPIWVQAPSSQPGGTDLNPPTIHLFIWRRADDLACDQQTAPGQGGFADYRLFAGRTPLVLGDNQTISIPLDNLHWTGCYGKPPLNIQDELNNLLGVGVTFGGQSFAGHGVYLSGGSAKFKINSFGVN